MAQDRTPQDVPIALVRGGIGHLKDFAFEENASTLAGEVQRALLDSAAYKREDMLEVDIDGDGDVVVRGQTARIWFFEDKITFRVRGSTLSALVSGTGLASRVLQLVDDVAQVRKVDEVRWFGMSVTVSLPFRSDHPRGSAAGSFEKELFPLLGKSAHGLFGDAAPPSKVEISRVSSWKDEGACGLRIVVDDEDTLTFEIDISTTLQESQKEFRSFVSEVVEHLGAHLFHGVEPFMSSDLLDREPQKIGDGA